MSWTIEWDEALGAVRITVSGIFSATGYQAMIEEGLSRPFWKPGTNTLVDYRNCSLNRGFDEMVSAATTAFANDDRIGDGRAAVVVATRSDYGSARQFFSVTDSTVKVSMQPFQDIDAAESWLLEIATTLSS